MHNICLLYSNKAYLKEAVKCLGRFTWPPAARHVVQPQFNTAKGGHIIAAIVLRRIRVDSK
jgi:hypothetical protein